MEADLSSRQYLPGEGGLRSDGLLEQEASRCYVCAPGVPETLQGPVRPRLLSESREDVPTLAAAVCADGSQAMVGLDGWVCSPDQGHGQTAYSKPCSPGRLHRHELVVKKKKKPSSI